MSSEHSFAFLHLRIVKPLVSPLTKLLVRPSNVGEKPALKKLPAAIPSHSTMAPGSSPESTISLYDLKDLNFHSCLHCEKVIVNHDYHFDVVKELGTEWRTVHLHATLGDVLEGSRNRCRFATQLTLSFVNLPNDALSAEFELCAKIDRHIEDKYASDAIGPFGFWNSATRRVEIVSLNLPSFNFCTPEGEHPR